MWRGAPYDKPVKGKLSQAEVNRLSKLLESD